jgi:hypothetical protein
MRCKGVFGTFVLLSLVAAVAGAQTNYVAVRGIVLDPQNLGIPAASVKLTDEKRGQERRTTADAHGVYEMGGLLPGAYVLEAVSPGFSPTKREVLLEVGQQATLDVMLQIGPAKETVTAETAFELLKTTDASVGEVVDQRSVSQLPLNGRMLVDLMLTVPGAHVSHGAQTGDMNPLYWRPGQRWRQSAQCKLLSVGWSYEYGPDV